MKVDTDIKRQALVVVEIPGLTTSTKGDNRKSTKEMASQHIEVKARHELFKGDRKL
jgi:hypothetical protein|tara:strand:+ start:391 stop:558 length:168 start_codon:yes stop_codon:yes gene_type:complete